DVDVLGRSDVVGGNEIFGQLLPCLLGARLGLAIDQRAVGQQLVAEHLDLFLGLAAGADQVARVVVGEARLDAVGRVVGQAQADGAGGRDGAVMGEARALFGQRLDQLGGVLGNLLHVARIPGVQYTACNLIADLVAVLLHFRTL